jgi:hypothetical protein
MPYQTDKHFADDNNTLLNKQLTMLNKIGMSGLIELAQKSWAEELKMPTAISADLLYHIA